MSGAPPGPVPDQTEGAPGTAAEGVGGRLPLLHPAELTDAQRAVYDQVVATSVAEARRTGFDAILPDGRLLGPINSFLYVPEIARGMGAWVDAQGRHAALPDDVREVAILAVAAAWGAPYELYAHAAGARRAGVPGAAIDAITAGRAPEGGPDGVSPAAGVAYRVADALVRRHAVDDALYAEAVAAFGAAGGGALVHPGGRYLTISALLTRIRGPAPPNH